MSKPIEASAPTTEDFQRVLQALSPPNEWHVAQYAPHFSVILAALRIAAAPSDVAGLVRQMRAEENFFANRMTGNGEISRIHCIEVATLLREAATALSSGDGWRFDMENAPRGNTRILIVTADGWRDVASWNGDAWVSRGEWFIYEPIGWQPLPAPPVEG